MHQPEHTPRTLFVDDESINQQIGAEILLALGAEADTADNGLQALRLIRTRHYAIVFTDVEMPVMDGATLTHILRSDSRYGELPIIACTSHFLTGRGRGAPPKRLHRRPPQAFRRAGHTNGPQPPCHTLRRSPRVLTGTQAPRRGGARHTGRT